MEALRDLVIARTGYPRYGALSEAAEKSGIAQSQLSRVVSGRKTDMRAETVRQFADWLGKDYNELLITVLGDRNAKPQPAPQPTTPHEQALRVVDVIAAAMLELRQALEAMAQASQTSINPGENDSSTKSDEDYLYQRPVLMAFAEPTRMGGRLRLLNAA